MQRSPSKSHPPRSHPVAYLVPLMAQLAAIRHLLIEHLQLAADKRLQSPVVHPQRSPSSSGMSHLASSQVRLFDGFNDNPKAAHPFRLYICTSFMQDFSFFDCHRLLSAATHHTPPEARLRLLLVGGVSFAFSFQFFTRLAAVFAM